MKLSEEVHKLQMEFSSFSLADETRFNEPAYWWSLIAEKRAIVAKEDYNRNGTINPALVQDMGIMETTRVDFSDDLGGECKEYLAKVKIPQIVHIRDKMMADNDIGVYKLISVCGSVRYQPTTLDMFNEILFLGGARSKQPYYFRIGNFIYAYPFRKELRPLLILNDPLDGYVIREYNVEQGSVLPLEISEELGLSALSQIGGEIDSNVVYQVTEGNITYNSISYQKGDTFIGIDGLFTFSGSGKVRHYLSRSKMTPDDEYPMSSDMMDAIRRLIRADMGTANNSPSDVKNDMQDEKNIREATVD